MRKSIDKFIVDFLHYCKEEKNLTFKSIETYSRCLNIFLNWLKEKKYNILPEELSETIIEEYKNYLSIQNISVNTNNQYLIAIRSFLSYLVEKNIHSLYPDKIKLYKQVKTTTIEPLDDNQIRKLLKSPNTSIRTGLRDRAILEFLISTGLKVNNVVSLNRHEIKINNLTKRLELKISDQKQSFYTNVYLSKNAVYWIKKYLDNRKDSSEALFIRYKGPMNASSRLTIRSVESIVKKYLKIAKLPSSTTPETLRTTCLSNLINEENNIKINIIYNHNILPVDNYDLNFKIDSLLSKKQSNSWYDIEQAINNELNWLKDKSSFLQGSYKSDNPFLFCNHCLLRKIAVLVVSGKIKAFEMNSKNKDLWNNLTKEKNLPKLSNHGKDWHKKMMDVLYHYFNSQGYKLSLEPVLNYGRADLGIYSKSSILLYIEVGTVSLYKLWYNFLTMKNNKFLLVPNEDYIIEFTT